MRKPLVVLLAAIVAISLCACANRADQTQGDPATLGERRTESQTPGARDTPVEQPTETEATELHVPEGEPAKSAAVDLIRDISLFDDDVEKVKALLGTPDEIEEASDQGYTKLNYEHYSYLGRDVRIGFRIDEDFERSEMVITYYYVREYEHSDPDDKFEPSAEQLRVAQDFKNEVIELLTSSYGQPIWKSDDGIEFVWVKEQRMNVAECIKLEHGYSNRAFKLYIWFA